MAVYTNDLRLKEIANGDESGTWGTSTNLNLKLIGEALSFQTEQVFSSDGDATTTVADGTEDPARGLFYKATSSGNLTATRVLTIAPPTISRVMFIENATSGSQSITVRQSAGGTNVTIPNGQTKAVYLDGADTNPNVVDAFTDLSVPSFFVSGDLDVDGTTNLDVVDIDGAVDMASTLQVDGAITSSAGATITVSDNSSVLTLKSTDDDASIGPILDLTRDSSSPAADDNLGALRFKGDDSGGNTTNYAFLNCFIEDPTDGAEDGLLKIETRVAGASKERITMDSTETVFNDDSADLDFRVESNGNANMLFVDAGNDAVIVGHSASIASAGQSHELQVYDTNFSIISGATYRDGSDGATITLGHSRSGTIGTQTILNDGDMFGGINFVGSDGTDMASVGAAIRANVDGTPGSNDMPGRLVFFTTADGAASATERMRIVNSGSILVNTTSFSSLGTIVLKQLADDKGIAIIDSGAANTLFIQNNGDINVIGNNASIPMAFETSSTERMRIDSNGRVGIGIQSPAAGLHVDGNFAGVPAVSIHQTGGASGDDRGLDVETSSTGTSVQRWFNAGTELMAVRGNGNVVIGTTVQPGSGKFAVNSGIASSTGRVIEMQQATTGANKAAAAFSLAIQNGGESTNAADLIMATSTGGSIAENARFLSGGGFVVGATGGLGSVTNSNRVTGGIFNTFADVVAAANNTATTMVSLGSAMATYIACAGFNGVGNTSAFGASAIIHADGTSYTLTHLVNPSGMTFSMSGSNVQVTHTGGATLNVSFSVIRIQ